MPHKIEVMKYCQKLSEGAKKIGSVNYISINEGVLTGKNTDGIAALNLVEEHKKVNGAHVVVFGAGGAGRAAIYEAKKRGAFVTVCNRSIEKGVKVATEFNTYFSTCIPKAFDVLINATSLGMDANDVSCIIDEKVDLKEVVVLDMASRSGDCMLKKFTKKHSTVYISGAEMFKSLTIHSLNETCKQHKLGYI